MIYFGLRCLDQNCDLDIFHVYSKVSLIVSCLLRGANKFKTVQDLAGEPCRDVEMLLQNESQHIRDVREVLLGIEKDEHRIVPLSTRSNNIPRHMRRQIRDALRQPSPNAGMLYHLTLVYCDAISPIPLMVQVLLSLIKILKR